MCFCVGVCEVCFELCLSVRVRVCVVCFRCVCGVCIVVKVVNNYLSTPRNIPEVRTSGLQGGETLKSLNTTDCQHWETIISYCVAIIECLSKDISNIHL